MPFSARKSGRQAGFTLVELIIGIVVLGIALTLMTGLIFPQAIRSVDPIYQVRGTELANALLNQIRGKAFDEQSFEFGGLLRCDEGLAPACGTAMGPEDTEKNNDGSYNLDLLDDVDDYHGLTMTGEQLASSATYGSLYAEYELAVTVFYDGDYDGVNNGSSGVQRQAKRIQVIVTLPNQDTLAFAIYRSNF